MLSGLKYSWKKISTAAEERFFVENMAYTQMFIDYLHAKDPFKLKFFDECGLSVYMVMHQLEKDALNSCVITVHLT